MTTPSRQQLREWSAALTLGPLDPADPKETRYVPLAEAGRAAVDELLATIDLALDSTTQLLSGPSGSGKTTELYRLRGELERNGFHAAISMSAPTSTSPRRSTSPSSSSRWPSARTTRLACPTWTVGQGSSAGCAAFWTASGSPSTSPACPPRCHATVWNSRRWARRSSCSAN